MAIASLRNVVTGNFIQTLSKLGSGGNKNPAAAALGKGGGSQPIDVSLRTAARNFGAGVQSLNAGISFVNVARDFNKKLLSVVDRMDLLVTRAGKGNLSGANAAVMRDEFVALGREFQDTLKKARFEGKDILSVSDLSAVLSSAGLSAEKVSELDDAFKKMSSLSGGTQTTADGAIISSATRLPVTEFASAVRRATMLDEIEGDPESEEYAQAEADAALANFSEIRDSLKEVRTKLRNNIDALDETTEVIRKNLELVRAAGFAFLEASQSVKGNESPDALAEQIRRKIQADAPGALAQAQNLESIMLAGLTISGGPESSQKR